MVSNLSLTLWMFFCVHILLTHLFLTADSANLQPRLPPPPLTLHPMSEKTELPGLDFQTLPYNFYKPVPFLSCFSVPKRWNSPVKANPLLGFQILRSSILDSSLVPVWLTDYSLSFPYLPFLPWLFSPLPFPYGFFPWAYVNAHVSLFKALAWHFITY